MILHRKEIEEKSDSETLKKKKDPEKKSKKQGGENQFQLEGKRSGMAQETPQKKRLFLFARSSANFSYSTCGEKPERKREILKGKER